MICWSWWASPQNKVLENATSDQKDSILWFDHRLGRITISTVHKVLHTNQNKPAPSLLKSLCSTPTYNLMHVDCVRWGREHGIDAFGLYKSYIEGTNLECQNVPTGTLYSIGSTCNLHEASVRSCGLFVSTNKPFLAASPDGLIACTSCGKGVLEIKCPHKWALQKITFNQMLTDNNSHLTPEGDLKRVHPYFSQVQLQMYATGADFCDFVTWTSIDVVMDGYHVTKPLFKHNLLC